jgi:hypothetical protein
LNKIKEQEYGTGFVWKWGGGGMAETMYTPTQGILL